MSSASTDPMADFCERMGEVRGQLVELLAVPLRVANRGRLDEELDELDASWLGLTRADRGPAESALERPMRVLAYRMRDVQLAVEDFRTTPKPAVAAGHVQHQGRALAAALDAVEQTAGCPR